MGWKSKSISTHAPLAGRDNINAFELVDGGSISTHAPLAGRDDSAEAAHFVNARVFQPTRPLRGATALQAAYLCMWKFQPTRPLRGATVTDQRVILGIGISTHAPLAGRDAEYRTCLRRGMYFNPRAPCGARPGSLSISSPLPIFQPTRPLRGATAVARAAPRLRHNFNPRAPCGARLRPPSAFRMRRNFNPRAPCGARLSPSMVV